MDLVRQLVVCVCMRFNLLVVGYNLSKVSNDKMETHINTHFSIPFGAHQPCLIFPWAFSSSWLLFSFFSTNPMPFHFMDGIFPWHFAFFYRDAINRNEPNYRSHSISLAKSYCMEQQVLSSWTSIYLKSFVYVKPSKISTIDRIWIQKNNNTVHVT